jgi:hypothetical protein
MVKNMENKMVKYGKEQNNMDENMEIRRWMKIWK